MKLIASFALALLLLAQITLGLSQDSDKTVQKAKHHTGPPEDSKGKDGDKLSNFLMNLNGNKKSDKPVQFAQHHVG